MLTVVTATIVNADGESETGSYAFETYDENSLKDAIQFAKDEALERTVENEMYMGTARCFVQVTRLPIPTLNHTLIQAELSEQTDDDVIVSTEIK